MKLRAEVSASAVRALIIDVIHRPCDILGGAELHQPARASRALGRLRGRAQQSSPNFTGEDNPIALPFSGLTISISNRYWQDSDPADRRPWIEPHIPVALTSVHWLGNEDPVPDAALAAIDRRRALITLHAPLPGLRRPYRAPSVRSRNDATSRSSRSRSVRSSYIM